MRKKIICCFRLRGMRRRGMEWDRSPEEPPGDNCRMIERGQLESHLTPINSFAAAAAGVLCSRSNIIPEFLVCSEILTHVAVIFFVFFCVWDFEVYFFLGIICAYYWRGAGKVYRGNSRQYGVLGFLRLQRGNNGRLPPSPSLPSQQNPLFFFFFLTCNFPP